MPIPREILDVTRPKNTVVIAYGRGKKLYAFRQRIGSRNVGRLPGSKKTSQRQLHQSY